jgi:hypothetical protein
LNFAASALFYEKPWLGPLYSWTSALIQEGKTNAVLPWGIRFILSYLADRLEKGERIMVVPELPEDNGVLFRTDAKAENGKATVGGWYCGDSENPKLAKWWFLEITREHFEWAFAKENNPQRTIATLELLGTLLAIIIFDIKKERFTKATVTISADTDNQGITLAMKKFMTTKWPLAPVLMELSEQLRSRNLELHLSWIHRDLNYLADAIMNEDFKEFSPGNRIGVDPRSIRWRILPEAMKWSKDVYDLVHSKKRKESEDPKTMVVGHEVWRRKKTAAHKRLKATDPW